MDRILACRQKHTADSAIKTLLDDMIINDMRGMVFSTSLIEERTPTPSRKRQRFDPTYNARNPTETTAKTLGMASMILGKSWPTIIAFKSSLSNGSITMEGMTQ